MIETFIEADKLKLKLLINEKDGVLKIYAKPPYLTEPGGKCINSTQVEADNFSFQIGSGRFMVNPWKRDNES